MGRWIEVASVVQALKRVDIILIYYVLFLACPVIYDNNYGMLIKNNFFQI